MYLYLIFLDILILIIYSLLLYNNKKYTLILNINNRLLYLILFIFRFYIILLNIHLSYKFIDVNVLYFSLHSILNKNLQFLLKIFINSSVYYFSIF